MLASVVAGAPAPRELAGTVAEALVRPGEFFGAQSSPRLRTAGLVVAVTAGLHASPSVILTLALAHLHTTTELARHLGLAVGWNLLYVAATWLVAALLLYLGSLPASGRGGGRRLLAHAAWGVVPSGVLSPLVVVVFAVAATQFGVPGSEAALEQFGRRLRDAPLVSVASAAGTARVVVTGTTVDVFRVLSWTTVLWGWYVWTAAVERARDLRRWQAAAVAALPLAAYLLLWYAT